MSTGIAHKEVLKSKRGRRMTEAEWEFATDDYKELRKVRKMKATQFKEYRDDITEGKFPRNLIAKALKIAKKSGGQMTKAWKQIEKIKKGLGDDPIIADALRVANEEAVAEWNTGTRRCKGGDGRRKLVKAQRALELATEEDDEVEEGYSSSQVKKAIKIAHDMGGNMTGAVKKIERIKRGLSDDEAVMDALKSANEELDEVQTATRSAIKRAYLAGPTKTGKDVAKALKKIKKGTELYIQTKDPKTGRISNSGEVLSVKGDDVTIRPTAVNRPNKVKAKDISHMDVHKALKKESLDERDYRKEYDNYQGSPEQIARRSSRNKARRIMGDDCEEGQDVGHKDNNPMNNDRANLRNEDPSKNRREPRLRKEAKADNKKLLKQYKKNEDGNSHSENYLLLAKAFGTPKQVKEVEAILKRNKKQGHTSEKDNKWMYKNINPYYKKLVSAAKSESFSGYREAIQERKLTDKELKRREEIAKNLDDEDLKKRYGDDWKAVKMGIATNMAKAESLEFGTDETTKNYKDKTPGEVDEAQAKYKINHKTYSSAVDEALKVADKQGYEVDMDDYFNQIATGPRKPGEGKTNTFRIALTKRGKEQKKKLQIQIYGKGKHGYELNCYIS